MIKLSYDPWVSRLKSNDQRDLAIQELRSILQKGMKAVCRNQLGHRISPEDVIQDALIKILDKLDTFEGRSKFTTWAMTIAVRTAVSEMRRKEFQNVSLNALLPVRAIGEPVCHPMASAETQKQRIDVLSRLQQYIDTRLTDKQRDSILLSLQGVPVEVIAAKTSSNRNAVYKRTHDARLKLRQAFEEDGTTADEIQAIFHVELN